MQLRCPSHLTAHYWLEPRSLFNSWQHSSLIASACISFEVHELLAHQKNAVE